MGILDKIFTGVSIAQQVMDVAQSVRKSVKTKKTKKKNKKAKATTGEETK